MPPSCALVVVQPPTGNVINRANVATGKTALVEGDPRTVPLAAEVEAGGVMTYGAGRGRADPCHCIWVGTEHADDMPGSTRRHAAGLRQAPGISDDQFSVMDAYQASAELMIGNLSADGHSVRRWAA